MFSAHRIKLLILGLLLFPAALFAQTSTTGRIDEGPLAARPTVCTPGDYYVSNDTNPVVEYKCSTGNNWQPEATGGGGGSPPGAPVNSPQCNSLGTGFKACGNNNAILYVSTTGSDSNNGTSWDTAKATIMAAVCALPTGNCSTTPKQAGAGTVKFMSGVSCNSNANAGCWISGSGDSQYPNMTGSQGGPSAWTIELNNPWPNINLVCATMDVGTTNVSRPTCTVNGPSHTVADYIPLVWVSGNVTGGFYINGMSANDGVPYVPTWGRIGIDSATGLISGTPTVTQTVSFTIENSYSTNDTGGGSLHGGPQLAIGNGFWMHIHDSGFGPSNFEGCTVSAASRTSNVVTLTTINCADGGVPAQCPFISGDHLSIRDTGGDGSFNGTFTATSSCGATNTVTFNQTGPNFSGSVGSSGIIVDDRAFGIVCYSCQIEMARMHNSGGIKFYSGSSSNLQLNYDYIEGTGAQNAPLLWISPLIYGGGGLVDVSGLLQSDTPLLPSMINEGGPLVFVHTEASQSTNIRGPAIVLNGNDALNRTTGFLASGQSGWLNNQYFEASTDISRRQTPITANLGTNIVPQNPASWTGSNFTTASGKRDPFGATGAIEIDATAGTSAYLYNVSTTLTVGDTWYYGGWVRAVNGTFSSANSPFAFYLGAGNICLGQSPSQPLTPPVSFLGDGNWFWLTGSCQVWANPANGIALAIGLDSTHPVQVYRPFLIKIPSGTLTPTEAADEMNALGFGPSTQAATGDIVIPADKKICLSSGSATNEFCEYLVHANTANRTTTFPDVNGIVPLASTNPLTSLTGQPLIAVNANPAAFTSPGIQDGNGGVPVTTTPYAAKCDSATTLLDRGHFLRLQTGASVVTVPLSTAGGCLGGFVFSAADESAAAITFNATSPDTFSVYNGGTVATGATSFSLVNGQFVTVNQGATGIWEVRITEGGVGAGAAPVTNLYLTNTCPVSNTGQCYFTPSNTQVANDCTWSNASTTVTCATSHFALTDVGKRVMGFFKTDTFGSIFGCVAGRISFSSMTTGTLTIASYTSGTQIALSANPSNTATGNNGCVIWGTPDDSNASTFETAYAAISSFCPKVMLAAAGYWFSSPHFFTQPVGCTALPALVGAGTTYGNMVYTAGFELEGRGPGNTVLYLGPDFPGGDTCAHATGGITGCFAVLPEGKWSEVQISGGAQLVCQVAASKNLLAVGVGTLQNVALTNMCNTSSSNIVGIKADLLAQLYQVNNSGWGAICLQNTATTGGEIYAYKLACENSPGGSTSGASGNNDGVNILSTTPFFPTFTCNGCLLLGAISNPGNVIGIAQGAEVHLVSTVINNCEAASGCVTSGTQMLLNRGGVVYLTDVTMTAQGGVTGVGAIGCAFNGGGKTFLEKTNLTNIGSQNYFDNAGCGLFDLGGNNNYFAGLSGAGNLLGGVVADGHSIRGTCTGTATSSSTLGLYGTGPNVTATTCTSTTIGSGIPMTQGRTLTGLIVSATHAGVNASSGLVTVLKNGVGTAATCTIGTATSCVGFANVISFSAGDLLSIQFTTQAAEVLAGVQAQVVWQ